MALALTGALAGESDEERAAGVVRSVSPATVRIEARSVGTRSGLGSGWVLDSGERLVVTAAHVVNTGQRFFVRSGAGESEAEIVGVAPCEDLAVLRASGALAGDALTLDGTGAARQGETVLAFGYPTGAEGEAASSTRGVVSAATTAFRDPAPDVPPYPSVVRTDSALDPGFSGGPLVDLDGRLVGINAAARREDADGRLLQGANYAVAADRARPVLEALRSGESLGWIGATFGYPSARDLAGRGLPPGLWVRGVVPGAAAARAGLRDGDYLVAVDGRALDGTLSGWCRSAGGLRSGATAELELARPGGRTRTVAVRLD
jgi:S1-C subfamily serine protease